VILDNDYLEAVSENFALNDLLQLRSLRPGLHRQKHGQKKRESGAVTQDTFSFGHVRFWESPLELLRAFGRSTR